MLVMSTLKDEFNELLELTNSNSKTYVQTTNKVLFKELSKKENTEVYVGEHISFPNKSFAFGFLSGLYLGKLNVLSKMSILLTKGFLIKGSTPYQFNLLIGKIDEIKKSNKGADKIREINKSLKEDWKIIRNTVKEENSKKKSFNKDLLETEKKRIKTLNKDIKSQNKETKKSWEDAIKNALEEQKAFMPEPTYIPLEEERDISGRLKDLDSIPEEPGYREVPYSKSFSIERLDKTHSFAWRLMSKYEFFRITGTNFIILKKREKELKYREDDLLSISIDEEMSLFDFREYFNKNELNDVKYLSNYRQDVSINPEQIDLYAKNTSFENSVYEEDEALAMEKSYPPLAPLKAQQKASMISGLKISKVLDTPEGKLIIKSAPVEVYYNRTVIIGNKEVDETIVKKEDLMSIYNMNYRQVEEL